MQSKVNLICGDCLEEMRKMEDNSIDLILCDMPYGITRHKDDKVIPLNEMWKEVKRIVKPTTPILFFASGLFYVDLVSSNRKMFKYDLVWDKGLTSGFLNAKRMPLRQHEHIAVFYEKLGCYNPQFTQGKPLHGKGKSYKEKSLKNQNYGKIVATEDVRKGCTDKYPTSIISFKKPHPAQTLHRTEKSIPLLEWLIKTYSNEGDTVLDFCMGSGTCGVAAVNTCRNFIGIEIDKDYYNLCNVRIKEKSDKITDND